MPDKPEPLLTPRELLLAQLAGKAKLQFSAPPISADEEGDLAFQIATDEINNVVRIRFSKPVIWLALGPNEAHDFAQLILKKVNLLESASNPPQE